MRETSGEKIQQTVRGKNTSRASSQDCRKQNKYLHRNLSRETLETR